MVPSLTAARYCLGGVVESHGDHRVAMAFAIASLVAQDDIVIHETAEIATSFPDFVRTAQQIGLALAPIEPSD